jgi:hypothetical protein
MRSATGGCELELRLVEVDGHDRIRTGEAERGDHL